jgi:hypothetical protein
MEIIRDMYDAHIHPTPKGPTGPPIPLMWWNYYDCK